MNKSINYGTWTVEELGLKMAFMNIFLIILNSLGKGIRFHCLGRLVKGHCH